VPTGCLAPTPDERTRPKSRREPDLLIRAGQPVGWAAHVETVGKRRRSTIVRERGKGERARRSDREEQSRRPRRSLPSAFGRPRETPARELGDQAVSERNEVQSCDLRPVESFACHDLSLSAPKASSPRDPKQPEVADTLHNRDRKTRGSIRPIPYASSASTVIRHGARLREEKDSTRRQPPTVIGTLARINGQERRPRPRMGTGIRRLPRSARSFPRRRNTGTSAAGILTSQPQTMHTGNGDGQHPLPTTCWKKRILPE